MLRAEPQAGCCPLHPKGASHPVSDPGSQGVGPRGLDAAGFPADHVLYPEGGHPAGHRLHCGQPELQAGARCAHAGLLRGGEHLLPQVLCPGRPKPSVLSLHAHTPLLFFLPFSLLEMARAPPGLPLPLRSSPVLVGMFAAESERCNRMGTLRKRGRQKFVVSLFLICVCTCIPTHTHTHTESKTGRSVRWLHDVAGPRFLLVSPPSSMLLYKPVAARAAQAPASWHSPQHGHRVSTAGRKASAVAPSLTLHLWRGLISV